MQSIMYDGNNKCDVWDFVVGDEGYTNCHQRFDNSLTVDLPNQRLVIKEQNTVICLDTLILNNSYMWDFESPAMHMSLRPALLL
jgi:hypothetical protein